MRKSRKRQAAARLVWARRRAAKNGQKLPAQGFFRDSKGKTHPITAAMVQKRKNQRIVPGRQLKQIAPKHQVDLSARLEAAMRDLNQLEEWHVLASKELEKAQQSEADPQKIAAMTKKIQECERAIAKRKAIVAQLKA